MPGGEHHGPGRGRGSKGRGHGSRGTSGHSSGSDKGGKGRGSKGVGGDSSDKKGIGSGSSGGGFGSNIGKGDTSAKDTGGFSPGRDHGDEGRQSDTHDSGKHGIGGGRAKASERGIGFGDTRPRGAYGRVLSKEEVAARAEVDAEEKAADESWDAGDYTGWLGHKVNATAKDLANDFGEGWGDFKQAPMDFVADVTRNPFVGMVTAVAAPYAALGLTGVQLVDSVMDYAQDEMTGMEATRQGLGDIAGSLKNQSLGLAARAIADPEGTLSGKIGGAMAGALGGGLLGAGAGALAKNLSRQGIDAMTGGDILGGTTGSGFGDLGGIGTGTNYSGGEAGNLNVTDNTYAAQPANTTTTVSSGGNVYTPPAAAGYQPQTIQEMYGLTTPGILTAASAAPGQNPLMSATTPSTFTPNNVKIENRLRRNQNDLMEQYPWLFDQGILAQPINPYIQ